MYFANSFTEFIIIAIKVFIYKNIYKYTYVYTHYTKKYLILL